MKNLTSVDICILFLIKLNAVQGSLYTSVLNHHIYTQTHINNKLTDIYNSQSNKPIYKP